MNTRMKWVENTAGFWWNGVEGTVATRGSSPTLSCLGIGANSNNNEKILYKWSKQEWRQDYSKFGEGWRGLFSGISIRSQRDDTEWCTEEIDIELCRDNLLPLQLFHLQPIAISQVTKACVIFPVYSVDETPKGEQRVRATIYYLFVVCLSY